MAKKFLYFTIGSLVLLLVSCASSPNAKSAVQLAKIRPVSLQSAAELEKQKEYMQALKQYAQCYSMSDNRSDLYSAMRGKARCLREMGHLKMALAALEPITVAPQNQQDCIQLALAGELLLQMKKYKEAESALEVALDGVRDHENKYAKWTAAASANLGKAYLHNEKLLQSKIMFKKAAALFRSLKRPQMVKKCFRTSLALDRIQTVGAKPN